MALPELSPERDAAAREEAERAEFDHQLKLRDIMGKLSDRRDEYVRGKADIEKRMVDDLRQYEGMPRIVGNKERPKDADASPPRIHRTRSRTDMMEARLSDMLLTKAAWGIKPTPVPQVAPELLVPGPNGEPPDPEAIAKAAAERMEKRLADTLAESKFPHIGRRMVRDACRVGTGLLMGPMTKLSHKRKFNVQQGAVSVEETPQAEVRYGDPFCFYPELVSTADKAQGAFYLHLMSRIELQEFARHPKVDAKAIARLLKTDPDLGEVGRNLSYRNQHSPYREETSGRYAVWRYTGVLERDEAEVLGLSKVEAEAPDDTLIPMPMVDLWFCQSEVLLGKISPFEGDFRIPYFVFAPFPADDSMFGLSLPYHCRDSQRVADRAYQIMLHNASVSSGPLIFGRRDAFQPNKGETMEVNGPRWFWVTDPDTPVKDMVEVVQFPNNAEQSMAILDRALEIMDDELNMPQVVGDVSASKPLTQTSSGMAMLMNQMLTIMQRRAAAAFDDDVIVPLIERLYWWEMQYGTDQAAKGDYCIEALGQAVLLVKDIRAQHLMMYLQLSEGNPRINTDEINIEIAKMLDIHDDRFLRSDEEVAKIQESQPGDPKIEVAKLRAETELQMLQGKMQIQQMEQKSAENSRLAQLAIADLKAELEVAKISSANATQAERAQSQREIARERRELDELRLGTDTQLRAEELASKERKVQQELVAEAPSPRLA